MGSNQAPESFTVGIDVGGTFVDVTIRDNRSGELQVGKVLADEGPTRSFLAALDVAVERAGTTLERIDRIVHGTTLTTNHILEQPEPRTVLVTTAGFEDVLEIGRHDSPRSGNIHRWVKPPRPIPRSLVLGVPERIAWDGTEHRPVDAPTFVTSLENLISRHAVASIAVSLLHAHVAPQHEKAIAALVNEVAPGLPVSLSHEVLPRGGEYERSMATVLNAFVQPVMGNYIDGLLDVLSNRGVSCPLYIMGSDGGIMSVATARELPIRTLLSGPAAGAAAAAEFAVRHEEPRVFTLDVGGTSSDVACAQAGIVDTTSDAAIGTFPIAVPVLDVHTVGAGGGSIARASQDRFLVGPESAGASPGPIAYCRGGSQPTVTDAQVVLGRLPTKLAGGSLTLDVAGARSAMESQLGSALSNGSAEAAAGVVHLANLGMANAIRRISTERGRDPREFTLVAFGGAGGAHAVEVARTAGLRKVLVPPSPGVFSTQGLLSAGLTFTATRTLPRAPLLQHFDLAELRRILVSLEAEGRTVLDQDPHVRRVRTHGILDLRYVNQAYELPVTIGLDEVGMETSRVAEEGFHHAHASRYGYRLDDVEVELVGIHVVVVGELPSPPSIKSHPVSEVVPPVQTRPVYFADRGWVDAEIRERSGLRAAQRVDGPAIIEEYDSTIVLPPGSSGEIRDDGAIAIDPWADERPSPIAERWQSEVAG